MANLTKKTINLAGKLVYLDKPLIMGILNVTPDSFYDGGRYTYHDAIINRVGQMLIDGADIIDVGAYSSRPGAADIAQDEEIERLTQALEVINQHYPQAVISVDTFRPEVARYVLKNFQVHMINDIMGGGDNFQMYEVVAKYDVPYVLMHIKGTPQTMQNNPHYENIIDELVEYFSYRIDKLRKSYVSDVIIDPGFGFGKTLEHNYVLMQNLDVFKKLFDEPLLVGISRKSMIFRLLGKTPQDALNGTTVLNTIALLKGADILRVHDVEQAAEVVKIVTKMQQAEA